MNWLSLRGRSWWRHPEVRALYEGIVEELNRNLARFEKLKRVLLVADEFSAENGTLTASMKLRRQVVEERYRQQIEEMYAQAEAAGPVTRVNWRNVRPRSSA